MDDGSALLTVVGLLLVLVGLKPTAKGTTRGNRLIGWSLIAVGVTLIACGCPRG